MTDRDEDPETAHVEDEYEEMQACPLPLMEVLDVLHGDKEVMYGTLHVVDDQELLNELQPFHDLGLEYGFSADFDSVADLKPDGQRGTTPVYAVQFAASRKADLLDQFFHHLNQGNERHIGRVLGYPDCCTETFYRHFRGEGRSIGEHVLEKTETFDVYPFYTNRFLRYAPPQAFLYHFPCRYGCEKSVEIAHRRHQLLRELDAAKAAYMRAELKSLIIYQVNRERASDDVRDETNIVYVSDYVYDADDRTVRIEGDVTKGRLRTDDDFFERIRGTSRIEVGDVNRFTLDSGDTISGDGVRIIPFR